MALGEIGVGKPPSVCQLEHVDADRLETQTAFVGPCIARPCSRQTLCVEASSPVVDDCNRPRRHARQIEHRLIPPAHLAQNARSRRDPTALCPDLPETERLEAGNDSRAVVAERPCRRAVDRA